MFEFFVSVILQLLARKRYGHNHGWRATYCVTQCHPDIAVKDFIEFIDSRKSGKCSEQSGSSRIIPHVHPVGRLVSSDNTVNSIMILPDTIKSDPVQNLRNFPSFASSSSLIYHLRWCSTSLCFAVISAGNFNSLDTSLVVGLRSAYIFVSFS